MMQEHASNYDKPLMYVGILGTEVWGCVWLTWMCLYFCKSHPYTIKVFFVKTCVCAGLVVIVSLRKALGSLKGRKKEDEQFAWPTILVYHLRNVCQPR